MANGNIKKMKTDGLMLILSKSGTSCDIAVNSGEWVMSSSPKARNVSINSISFLSLPRNRRSDSTASSSPIKPTRVA